MLKSLAAYALAALILSGCATTQPGLVGNNNENTKKGGIMGAVTGAFIGLTQSSSKNRTRNTILGAVGGGAAGALIGYNLDQQANEVANALGTRVDNDPLSQIDPNRTLIVSKGEGFVKIMFRDKMMFPTASDRMTSTAKYKVSKVGELLRRYPQTVVGIAGFTDNRGSYEYNQKLSSKRAQAVANTLHKKGIQNNINTQGCSYSKPLVSNTTASNMALNRRVEIYLYRGDSARINPCR
ncbi:MAG: OmpA family protein [Sulfurovum sp.]|nr:OmpA family protein [Sulfurovum sp.]